MPELLALLNEPDKIFLRTILIEQQRPDLLTELDESYDRLVLGLVSTAPGEQKNKMKETQQNIKKWAKRIKEAHDTDGKSTVHLSVYGNYSKALIITLQQLINDATTLLSSAVAMGQQAQAADAGAAAARTSTLDDRTVLGRAVPAEAGPAAASSPEQQWSVGGRTYNAEQLIAAAASIAGTADSLPASGSVLSSGSLSDVGHASSAKRSSSVYFDSLAGGVGAPQPPSDVPEFDKYGVAIAPSKSKSSAPLGNASRSAGSSAVAGSLGRIHGVGDLHTVSEIPLPPPVGAPVEGAAPVEGLAARIVGWLAKLKPAVTQLFAPRVDALSSSTSQLAEPIGIPGADEIDQRAAEVVSKPDSVKSELVSDSQAPVSAVVASDSDFMVRANRAEEQADLADLAAELAAENKGAQSVVQPVAPIEKDRAKDEKVFLDNCKDATTLENYAKFEKLYEQFVVQKKGSGQGGALTETEKEFGQALRGVRHNFESLFAIANSDAVENKKSYVDANVLPKVNHMIVWALQQSQSIASKLAMGSTDDPHVKAAAAGSALPDAMRTGGARRGAGGARTVTPVDRPPVPTSST